MIISCDLMLAVLHCYAVTNCHELWGCRMKGEIKSRSCVSSRCFPRSSTRKKEGDAYQTVLGLTIMKTYCVDLIGYTVVGNE